MHPLQQKAAELLESGRVKVVIGFGEGSGGRVRAVFVRNAAEAATLLWDDRCTLNLAVYVNKPEIKAMGDAAVVSSPAIVRSLIQLTAEQQCASSKVCALVVGDDGVRELGDRTALEEYAAAHPVALPPPVEQRRAALAAMSAVERREFWTKEFSRCFKCYACRAACPLCYCERCVTDVNQPQWVAVAPHGLGVMEWHANRAMHLAGRCIQCGACSVACPVGIPIALLTIEATRVVAEEFGYQAGLRCDAPAALSSFKVDDKETFIQ